MGISLRKWLKGQNGGSGRNQVEEIACADLYAAWQDYQIYQLAFESCVAMIANAVGKVEFKTFRDGNEVREREWYLFNVEPNWNQSSTVFLHELIYKLYKYNEVLVVAAKKRGKNEEMLLVADSFGVEEFAEKPNVYSGVVVGDLSYRKTFKESEVLHFKLNNTNILPFLQAMARAYNKLIDSAMKNYNRMNSSRMKVHVDQIASGESAFGEKFAEMVAAQIKPFLQAESDALLPEFVGYTYTDLSKAAVNGASREIRAMIDDVFHFAARCFGIPPVLLLGDVAGTGDATQRWLTTCIDPLCDQLQEEINRKRYGYEDWTRGTYLKIDTSGIQHFDLFGNAANIEKMVGSGVFSINDVRIGAGLAPIPADWANQYYITKNFSTVEAMTQIPEGGGDGE